ncbi:opioid growth factor receptor conserved region-domain-containing protein [Trametes punicea]|nr:opioid growth factor receptor conserved region-domain-containing protein [Trametes punicea]
MARVISSHSSSHLRNLRTSCSPSHPVRSFASAMALPQDIREFLEGYPDVPDDPRLNANVEFYSNRRRCRPDNLLIDELHQQWKTDYAKLEYKHGYIQWLFPLQEYGMNYEAQPLQKHEIATMKADAAVMERLHRSYMMMLGFYGMELVSRETGELRRADNWEDRYRNLVRAPHNNLRISRILKCLSEFGLERLNAGFLLFVLVEQSARKQLDTSMLRSSMDRWWANCLRNDEERRWVNDMVRRVRSQSDFVFTEDEYRNSLRRRKETGSFRA